MCYIWIYGYIHFLGENECITTNSYGDRLVKNRQPKYMKTEW